MKQLKRYLSIYSVIVLEVDMAQIITHNHSQAMSANLDILIPLSRYQETHLSASRNMVFAYKLFNLSICNNHRSTYSTIIGQHGQTDYCRDSFAVLRHRLKSLVAQFKKSCLTQQVNAGLPLIACSANITRSAPFALTSSIALAIFAFAINSLTSIINIPFIFAYT